MKKIIACPRTFSSDALNVLLKLTSKRSPKTEKTEAHCRKYIQSLAAKNEKPFPNPEKDVGQPVEDCSVDGMQTFIWGISTDPDQPVILYLHGGAYMNQPVSFHFKMVSHIAASIGAKVCFPVYPKIPVHDHKETYAKLKALYEKILAVHKPENVILMGDSSGAGLALGFACWLRDNQKLLPRELMLFCPWLDVHTAPDDLEAYLKNDPTLSPWRLRIMGEMWAGSKEEMSSPYVSPMFCYPVGLPPITMLTGTHDVLCPDILKFDEKLDRLGVEHKLYVFEGMVHDFIAFPIAQAKPAQELVIRLLKR